MAILAFTSGAAGAVALNLVHETARQAVPDAPRIDILGKRAVAAGARALEMEPPSAGQIYGAALAGDLVSNAAYYSLVGLGGAEGAVSRGALLGLAAGLGAVFLPGPLGLGAKPSARTPETAAMTVAWYALGGLVAGAVYRCLHKGDATG